MNEKICNKPLSEITLGEFVNTMKKALKETMNVKEKRPKESGLGKIKLDDDEWHMLADLKHVDVWGWKIYNEGDQDVYFAYNQGDAHPNTLHPDSTTSENTHPDEIWVKRSDSDTKPEVHLEYWHYGEVKK